MSNKLKQSLPHKELKRYCLAKEDWDKMAGALMAAEELLKSAELISEEDWKLWTSEFSAEQGFPAIIYHDMPIIVKPIT